MNVISTHVTEQNLKYTMVIYIITNTDYSNVLYNSPFFAAISKGNIYDIFSVHRGNVMVVLETERSSGTS